MKYNVLFIFIYNTLSIFLSNEITSNAFITPLTFKSTSNTKSRAKITKMTMETQESSSVLIVGLNPALQKRFILSPNTDLIPGDVHRATSIQQGVGGKGQDVLITLSCLSPTHNDDDSETMKIAISQFIGSGPEGDNVLQLLHDQINFDERFTIRTKSPIRTCTTIVATDHSTELVEPSGIVEPEELEALLSSVEEQAQTNSLCIMGSMPPGCPSDTYASILKRMISTTSNPIFCLIDSVIGLNELLEELATGKASSQSSKVSSVLKVNIAELCKLGGQPIEGMDENEKEKLSNIVKGFFSTYPNAESALDYIAITAGKDPAYVVQLESDGNEKSIHFWKLNIPNLAQLYPNNTLYPIGAGDSVASGTLAAWLELACSDSPTLLDTSLQSALSAKKESFGDDFDSFIHAFAFGLVCGSASCLQEQNSVLKKEDLKKLFMSSSKPSKL